MTALADEQLEDAGGGEPDARPPAGDGWKVSRSGKKYINAVGRKGVIYQKGDETPEQALELDGKPHDQRPRKSRTAKKPPPPTKADLRELEELLSEALCSPAVMCATFGDEWAANHFTNQGPLLARNLIRASEHNPWLRKKLENAATGGDMMMQLISLVGVGGALFGYAIPPVIYWFNVPVPDKARQMFGIPERRAPVAPHAAPEPAAEPIAA